MYFQRPIARRLHCIISAVDRNNSEFRLIGGALSQAFYGRALAVKLTPIVMHKMCRQTHRHIAKQYTQNNEITSKIIGLTLTYRQSIVLVCA